MKTRAKLKVMMGHSNDPSLKMAVLGLKKPKNSLIYYYRYLKKWFYEKVSLAKLSLNIFFGTNMPKKSFGNLRPLSNFLLLVV